MEQFVYVFLAEGFEEVEALTTVDLLRRAGLNVWTVSVSDHLNVYGAHHIEVIADKVIAECRYEDAQAFVLPGGMPGVAHLESSETLQAWVKQAYAEDKLIAAICAAPRFLGKLGLLAENAATCYPGFEEFLGEGELNYSDKDLVVGDKLITAKGLGKSIDFALAIVERLLSSEVAEKIAKAIIHR